MLIAKSKKTKESGPVAHKGAQSDVGQLGRLGRQAASLPNTLGAGWQPACRVRLAA